MKSAAKVISIVFHPVLIPTIGFILLLNTNFYFSMLSWEIKRFVLSVVFFTTCLLPVLTLSALALHPKFDPKLEKSTDRILPLMFTAIYYYIGYYLLGKINVYPIFKIFLLTSILVIIGLMLISFRWKISSHTAGIGGMLGTILALSFRMGLNPVLLISGLMLITGLIGTARLLLNKHDLPQVLAGFALGFAILYLTIYFV